MKKESRKLMIFSLLFLFAMIFTWNSCTKQDEVTNERIGLRKIEFEDALVQYEQQSKIKVINSSLELRNTGISDTSVLTSCWDPDSIYCDGDMEFIGTDTMVIDLYDNCKALVVYDLWRCWYEIPNDPGHYSFTYYFDNFTAVPVPQECDSITLLWQSLYDQGLYDDLEESFETFVLDAQDMTEYVLMSDLLSGPAGVFFRCTIHNNMLYSKFYVASCYQAYWGLKIKGGIPRPDRITLQCGESCCVSLTKWCISNSGKIVHTDPFIDQVGECEGGIYHIIPGYWPVGDSCKHDCEGENN